MKNICVYEKRFNQKRKEEEIYMSLPIFGTKAAYSNDEKYRIINNYCIAFKASSQFTNRLSIPVIKYTKFDDIKQIGSALINTDYIEETGRIEVIASPSIETIIKEDLGIYADQVTIEGLVLNDIIQITKLAREGEFSNSSSLLSIFEIVIVQSELMEYCYKNKKSKELSEKGYPAEMNEVYESELEATEKEDLAEMNDKVYESELEATEKETKDSIDLSQISRDMADLGEIKVQILSRSTFASEKYYGVTLKTESKLGEVNKRNWIIDPDMVKDTLTHDHFWKEMRRIHGETLYIPVMLGIGALDMKRLADMQNLQVYYPPMCIGYAEDDIESWKKNGELMVKMNACEIRYLASEYNEGTINRYLFNKLSLGYVISTNSIKSEVDKNKELKSNENIITEDSGNDVFTTDDLNFIGFQLLINGKDASEYGKA